MSNKVNSELSGTHSSTTMNVEKYIQDTELSDGIINQDKESAKVGQDESPDGNMREDIVSHNKYDSIAIEDNDDENSDISDLLSVGELSIKKGIDEDHESGDLKPKLKPSVGLGMNKSPTLNGILKNAYQTKLKYLPNQNFSEGNSFVGSVKGLPMNSIPNTFKYKSHPNARTKSEIGKGDSDQINESKKENIEKIVTSAQNASLEEKDCDGTPDWMPHELQDKWIPPQTLFSNQNLSTVDDLKSSVRIHRTPKDQSNNKVDFNLNLSSANTMIHNSDQQNNETPMWRKATKSYEYVNHAQQLQNIFLTTSNEDKKSSFDIRDINNHVNSSTISTSFTSLNRNKDSSVNAENVYSQHHSSENHNDDYQKNQYPSSNPESPLKLFGDKYNTFTKEKLTHLLAQMNYRKSNNQKTSISEDALRKDESKSGFQVPKLKIKKFTREGAYTEEEFFKNANNIFNNIQKRGFPSKADQLNIGNNQTTSTSTPIVGKRVQSIKSLESDRHSSFTSDFNDDELSTKYEMGVANKEAKDDASSMNDYTSFNNSSKSTEAINNYHSLSNKNLERLQNQLSNSSSYTYDSLSAIDMTHGAEYEYASINNIDSGKKDKKDHISVESLIEDRQDSQEGVVRSNEIRRLDSRIHNLEEAVKSFQQKDVGKILNELSKLREQLEKQNISHDENDSNFANDTLDGIDDNMLDHNVIRWKRKSQLRLNSSRKPSKPVMTENNTDKVVIGRVKPGTQLPSKYNDMVLDVENQKWVLSNKENIRESSLDFIEDLATQSDYENHITPVKQTKSKKSFVHHITPKKNNNKQEVSFQLPHSSQSSKKEGFYDITQVSQLENVTFSQVRKKLVAIITDKLSSEDLVNTSWSDVLNISLSSYGLQSIKDLDKFLPSLKELNVADNEIKFLDGLPRGLLKLDISNNSVENIASFRDFHDLQSLDLSSNRLTNLTNIDRNIHLTQLNVSNNNLTSLDGIMELPNLIKLDASQNALGGEVNFVESKLQSLQSLNLSENYIKVLEGIDSLSDLRVLNLNENNLERLYCNGRHLHLKKLSVKFNNLKELDVSPFPCLRVLRFDSNKLNTILNLKQLKHINEISCKSQNNSGIIESILDDVKDVNELDMSGNFNYDLFSHFQKVPKQLQSNLFWNVNRLALSAMGLTEIPRFFSDSFPNVRELNLNFNRLSNVDGLSGLCKLKKLSMVSNNISKIESTLSGLIGARNSLSVLDLRLNPCNIELYPYVFNPQELEYGKSIAQVTSPIQLDTADDIENFAIHYRSLSKNVDDWMERDSAFVNQLTSDVDSKKVNRRLDYETLLINFFLHLKTLDGGIVSDEKRKLFQHRLSRK